LLQKVKNDAEREEGRLKVYEARKEAADRGLEHAAALGAGIQRIAQARIAVQGLRRETQAVNANTTNTFNKLTKCTKCLGMCKGNKTQCAANLAANTKSKTPGPHNTDV
jgi:hypothetical protein